MSKSKGASRLSLSCAEWAPRRVTRDAEMIEITCDLDQYKLPIGGVVVSVLVHHP